MSLLKKQPTLLEIRHLLPWLPYTPPGTIEKIIINLLKEKNNGWGTSRGGNTNISYSFSFVLGSQSTLGQFQDFYGAQNGFSAPPTQLGSLLGPPLVGLRAHV